LQESIPAPARFYGQDAEGRRTHDRTVVMAPLKTGHGLVTWEDLTITLEDGQVLTASYGHTDRLVTVITARGSRTAGFGLLPPVVMARILLRQLAEDGLD
jgi:hypothetical protein